MKESAELLLVPRLAPHGRTHTHTPVDSEGSVVACPGGEEIGRKRRRRVCACVWGRAVLEPGPTGMSWDLLNRYRVNVWGG